jgi:hypothetical protein
MNEKFYILEELSDGLVELHEAMLASLRSSAAGYCFQLIVGALIVYVFSVLLDPVIEYVYIALHSCPPDTHLSVPFLFFLTLIFCIEKIRENDWKRLFSMDVREAVTKGLLLVLVIVALKYMVEHYVLKSIIFNVQTC